jgi:DNA adenine methylase
MTKLNNNTILKRIGNKGKIAHKIIPFFPKHDIYIELFFGAGGMFFNKPKAKYNFLNDIDNDVFNLYMVMKSNRLSKLLYQEIQELFISEALFKYWKVHIPKNRIKKALRFLFLSNCCYMGQNATLHITCTNPKQLLLKSFKSTKEMIKDGVIILNSDYRDVSKKVSIGSHKDGKNYLNTFVYADPPYLGTGNRYKQGSWGLKDTTDLFELLINSPYKFAISEFDSVKINELIVKYGLNKIVIGERQSLKNRNTEILITNYVIDQMELF